MWRFCQLVSPYMETSGYGSIINISTMAFINKSAAISAYTSSKVAINHMAGVVLYFAAPISAWVSGQVLFVNGGGVQTLD